VSQANLTVNLIKSEFGHCRITFLGHVVGEEKIYPIMAKVEAVTSFPEPSELMRFLGMAGYYRKFCHNFSVIVVPLTNLLKKQQP